jgi:hypothetical protein
MRLNLFYPSKKFYEVRALVEAGPPFLGLSYYREDKKYITFFSSLRRHMGKFITPLGKLTTQSDRDPVKGL